MTVVTKHNMRSMTITVQDRKTGESSGRTVYVTPGTKPKSILRRVLDGLSRNEQQAAAREQNRGTQDVA